MAPTRKLPALDAQTLQAHIEIQNACWLWTGKLNSYGYGRYGIKFAHRLSYEIHKGPIPPGMQVDHLCFNPSCVRPDHLRLVDPDTNNRRKLKALATECQRGHPFTPENTGRQHGNRRLCLTCDREGQRRRYRLRKQAKETNQ